MASKKTAVQKSKTVETENNESSQTRVTLRPINIKRFSVKIAGREGSPLCIHRFGKKAQDEIRDKKLKQQKRLRERLDAEAELRDALYETLEGDVGFPVGGIKSCMTEAAHRDMGVEKTLIRKAVFILGDGWSNETAPRELVFIKGNWKGREDIVRVGGTKGTGKPDLRYRPFWDKWSIDLRIEYDADLITPEVIINLLNRAGFGVGIGEHRPQKDGTWGRFEVVSSS